MEVNQLGFVATILFVLVPSVFLIILYIHTASRQGGKAYQFLLFLSGDS